MWLEHIISSINRYLHLIQCQVKVIYYHCQLVHCVLWGVEKEGDPQSVVSSWWPVPLLLICPWSCCGWSLHFEETHFFPRKIMIFHLHDLPVEHGTLISWKHVSNPLRIMCKNLKKMTSLLFKKTNFFQKKMIFHCHDLPDEHGTLISWKRV